MESIEVVDLPANASAYQLDDGRIFRVHLDLKTPMSLLAQANDIEVETRGYQINEAGVIQLNANLEPIMLPPQRARIPLVNVREGRDLMKPGWVERAYTPEAGVPEGTQELEELPATGTPGEPVLTGGKLYSYTKGLYESVRISRLSELGAAVPTPLADQAFVDSLIP